MRITIEAETKDISTIIEGLLCEPQNYAELHRVILWFVQAIKTKYSTGVIEINFEDWTYLKI